MTEGGGRRSSSLRQSLRSPHSTGFGSSGWCMAAIVGWGAAASTEFACRAAEASRPEPLLGQRERQIGP